MAEGRRLMPLFRRAGRASAGEAMGFPVVDGRGSEAARLPWRLPDEPTLSGIAADAVTVGALTVRAASIVGPGHRCEEPAQPRQDVYRLGRDPEGRYLLVAVADGMSDSANSHQGASVAVTTMVERLREDLGKGLPLDAPGLFLAASRRMAGWAEQRNVTENEVRAVALAAAVPVEPDDANGRNMWLGWLADVGAWLRGPAGWQRVVGEEKKEMDGAVSDFLPFHADRARSAVIRVERGAILALTTDGIGDAFDAGAGGWFARRWASPPHIASFIADVGYEARARHDDRTAVVIWCDR
jgi:hypothetical protein